MDTPSQELDLNKMIMGRHIEAHNQQDAHAAADFFAPEAFNHGRACGPENMDRLPKKRGDNGRKTSW